ncbi:3-oxoacyl-[acyl-carrier-protein] synthase III C-terminal domain-containing protein [Bremerella sp. P1]|uniref:3-oxoacyl-[acyl-carrier-protein] synthase III C-terminal domain-containing protein n=1 Tax=Bremerella sp. P1 TaxID=3026424 RepID=UPI0023685E36|nr:3-oxoacyl-[acyl-carrier-protein] synthase III C-terminal domain-containing protein [Bremerella sp. P1]WDI39913.1 3-oxoacyl-[acyl-carrier-protein] synthase III C-terminal domain-containing protein [Bremerella sp. P1]
MECFITATGSYLPGPAISNEEIHEYLGSLDGESQVAQSVLKMNGIVSRHYATDRQQQATHDVYDLATRATQACLSEATPRSPVTFLSAGSTYAPYSGPGIASIIHSRLGEAGVVDRSLELSSHGGICTSASAALVAAVRSVKLGEHQAALSIGTEHASEILKSSSIRPIDDRAEHADLRKSQWFMSVFLRFMLSDGGGACLLESQPLAEGLSFRVDWTHSMSFAHRAPLCMKLDNSNRLLSQDVGILTRHLYQFAGEFVAAALEKNDEQLGAYRMILPHMSSYFFRRKMEKTMQKFSSDPEKMPPYWTNLATAGNTGAASIYVMLDEFVRTHEIAPGDRLLLFIPESGQFNFVLVSLTAV